MIADQWCETSWRAQPGSFVSLMTLYESNFVRLRWLVPDLRAITDRVVSRTPSDCDLYLTPMDLSRYTSVFRLTYEFGDQSAGGGEGVSNQLMSSRIRAASSRPSKNRPILYKAFRIACLSVRWPNGISITWYPCERICSRMWRSRSAVSGFP